MPERGVLLLAIMLLVPATARGQNGAPVTRIEFLKYGSKATTVALSNDGTYIAIGTRDASSGRSRVVLWNRALQTRVRTASFPGQRPPKVAFDSAGSRLAVAPRRSNVTIWHLDSPRTDAPHRVNASARTVAYGQGGVLGVGTGAGDGGSVRVWNDDLEAVPTVLKTEGPVRSIAFSPTTSEVVLTSARTQVTVWNYRLGTKQRIDTFERCPGLLRQVEMPGRATYFYAVTKRRTECDTDYLCTISVKNRSVIDRFRRKNIHSVEHIRDALVAYSRGRYVYTLNLETREERIVFTSDNAVHDLSYAAGHLVVANSNVVVLPL